MDLNEIRREIDIVDHDMVKTFEKRMDLVRRIAKLKKKNGASIYDIKREDDIVNKMSEKLKNKEYEPYVRQFAKCMLTVSRKMQSDMIDPGK